MFAKLKQRIQDEGVDLKTDLKKGFGVTALPSPTNSSSATPTQTASGETTPVRNALSPDPHRRHQARHHRDSSDSLNENGSFLNNSAATNSLFTYKEFSITDSPGTPDRGVNEISKDADVIIKELKKCVREEKKQREKLESMLEKQQDILKKRLEERMQEYTVQLEKMEREKSELEKKLLEASTWKDKYIRDHEAAEELEGFQTQELAKVKHLLLLCQQDLQQSETSLKHMEGDLENTRQSYSALEQETERLKWKYNKLEEESMQLKENSTKDELLLKELKETKESLGKKVLKLTWMLEENRIKSSKLEQSLSALQDDYDSFKHNQDVYSARSDALIEEKDGLIRHYDERIQTLERRLADSNLGDDERVQALLTERNGLEVKLEESRQHLNEVKTTWSEKITALEKQIAHLNIKMAEDRDECIKNEDLVRSENHRLQTKIHELEKQVEETRALNVSLLSKIEQKEDEFKKAKSDLRGEIEEAYRDKEAASRLLSERVQSFEARMALLETERDEEIQKHQNKIAHLESRDTDHLSKENELEKRIDKLRDDKGKLEKSVELLEMKIKKNEKVMDESNSVSASLASQVEELTASLKEEEVSRGLLKERLAELETELLAARTENEDQLSKNAVLERHLQEASHELELAKKAREKDNEDVQEKFKELQLTLASAEDDRRNLKEKILDLENSLDGDHIENSDRVINLKTSLSELENQLAEKTKTIKLQHQRLSDMKKTLQRELRMQPPLLETANETSDKDVMPLVPMHLSRMLDVPIGSFVHDRPVSLADKLDDINFRYIKHVILKFMTSREYEAQQLVKAIGVLLDFSSEEERLVRETLDWKMSWFGSKPQASRPHVGNRTIMS